MANTSTYPTPGPLPDTYPEEYDLMLVIDATSSMSIYLNALRTSLPRIISISALTGAFQRIGLLGYRDYCDDHLLEWSGWLDPTRSGEHKQPDLAASAKRMQPIGGGDIPEALKSALASAYDEARPNTTTLMLLYTDAPPHLLANRDDDDEDCNHRREMQALSDPHVHGGYGAAFKDWVSATAMLRGEKKFQVISILPRDEDVTNSVMGLFTYMGTLTHGATILLEYAREKVISKMTVEVLLSWMQVDKAGAERKKDLQGMLIDYVDPPAPDSLTKEDDTDAGRFFLVPGVPIKLQNQTIKNNLNKRNITRELLDQTLPKRKTPVTNFATAWHTDPAYREMAFSRLEAIIDEDVVAMASDDVFGSLWRAVCSGRDDARRDKLVNQFSVNITHISNETERAFMKTWLANSYDFSADILATINRVPPEDQFPCVLLDPTVRFERENTSQPITQLTRSELLEISRTCDRRVLAQLSKVLTRLTYVESAADLAEHLSAASIEDVPRIPLALTKPDYDRKFWRVLLHVVAKGTLLSARPAALTAALAISVGIEPLMDSAAQEMIFWQGRWNDLDTPENWNSSCLMLLLDADRAYQKRNSTGLLLRSDRDLFKKLVAFHVVMQNLTTPLTARISWTPEKSRVPIGPLRTCPQCAFPRSVTMMNSEGICGICASEYQSDAEKQTALLLSVSMEDTSQTQATWVECKEANCQAQYVIYSALRCAPKCYYCRVAADGKTKDPTKAPTIQCSKCLSRIIWPNALRPDVMDAFVCPACEAGRMTIVETEITISDLHKQNADMGWLIHDIDHPDEFPTTVQSMFKTVKSYGGDEFARRFTILPKERYPSVAHKKPLHDPDALKKQLQTMIATQYIAQHSCSMCFESSRQASSRLTTACGRSGCTQKACPDCMKGWYGLNGPGTIINTAALHCPFCRRLADSKKLARWGNGVHAVFGLSDAVHERGAWIYGWCLRCGKAKPMVERLCARGAPEEAQRWNCDECRRDVPHIVADIHALEGEICILRGQGKSCEAQTQRLGELQRFLDELQVGQVRPCPGCGVMTQKINGCDHITCPNCRSHWCYFCGEAFDAGVIYDHMMREHGGFRFYEIPGLEEEVRDYADSDYYSD